MHMAGATRAEPAPAPALPAPIEYELRIGVTGHRDLADPDAVETAVRQLLRQVIAVLESASAAPLGPHGTPQSLANRLDRRLTQSLSTGTRMLCPMLDAVTRVAGRVLRRTGLAVDVRAVYWPAVPPVTDAPDADRQTPLKLTVISALAKGADQIVARGVCGLVNRPERRNRYLEAVLPFPRSEYEEDFTDEADLRTFHDLLALDRGRWNTHPEPTVLCPDFPACPDPVDPAVLLTRENAYAVAGRYVVETSEVIVAIWDPAREEKPGGTGETVRYAIDRGRLVLWLNPANLEAGPFVLEPAGHGGQPAAVHARAESGSSGLLDRLWQRLRRGDADATVSGRSDHPTDAPRGLRVELVPTRAKALSRNFHRLAAYNRDPAVDERELRRELVEHGTRLEALAASAGLPDEATRTLVDALLPHVVRADHLSARYRQLRELAARLWPAAAALVVTVMAFQIIFLPDMYWLAFVELGVLLLGYVSYRVSLYGGWHEKWLNDRRLADGLRAALFTALVLSDEDDASVRGQASSLLSVFGRVQDPLPFFDPANAWFVSIVKRVLRKERRRFAAALDFDSTRHRAAVRTLLKDGWIRAELDSHHRSAQQRQRAIARSGRLRLSMILALMVVALLHALGVGHGGDHAAIPPLARVDLWIGFATVALPAWAGAFHVMLTLEDGARRAERSALMASLLRGLSDRLESADSLGQFRECVAEAERLLDLESHEWAESLVDRKPEFTG